MAHKSWWRNCMWIQPSWWKAGPDGQPRDLRYTRHALDRSALYDLPVFAKMPKNIQFCEARADNGQVTVTFTTHHEGRDIQLVVCVPLFREYGVVVTCYDKAERGRKYRSALRSCGIRYHDHVSRGQLSQRKITKDENQGTDSDQPSSAKQRPTLVV